MTHSALGTALFQPVTRWGWEYREPDTLAAPWPEPAPVPDVPAPPGDARVTGLARSGVGWLGAAALGLGVAAVAVVGRPGLAWAGLAATLLLVVGGSLVAVWYRADVAYRLRVAAMQAEWMRRCARAHEAYRTDQRSWRTRYRRHLRTERERLRSQSPWVPVVPGNTHGRVDVYGGTPAGWAAWLGVTCGSLVASGTPVTVLDVSRTGAGEALAWLARAAGQAVDHTEFPRDRERADPLAGRSPAQVAQAISEAVHATEHGATHAARSLDARVLGMVCDALDPPLTIDRIGAALRALLHQQPTPDNAAVLGVAEFDRVAMLFGEAMHRQVDQRLATLEAVLHPLWGLGSAPDRNRLPAVGSTLRVIGIADPMTDLSRELLTHLLLQLLSAEIRDGGTGARPVLVVVGADALSAKHLGALHESAGRQGRRVVFVFQHLRGDTTGLLGDADTVFFLRLGNAAEASAAAEFIGREHRFVLHQHGWSTASATGRSGNRSESTSMTTGVSMGYQQSSRSTSLTEQHTTGTGWTTGTTDTVSGGDQRVYEFTVEPGTLQGLADTAFVVVRSDGANGRRARFGDCHPAIAVAPAGYLPRPPRRAGS